MTPTRQERTARSRAEASRSGASGDDAAKEARREQRQRDDQAPVADRGRNLDSVRRWRPDPRAVAGGSARGRLAPARRAAAGRRTDSPEPTGKALRATRADRL